jgi:hypothetical protein
MNRLLALGCVALSLLALSPYVGRTQPAPALVAEPLSETLSAVDAADVGEDIFGEAEPESLLEEAVTPDTSAAIPSPAAVPTIAPPLEGEPADAAVSEAAPQEAPEFVEQEPVPAEEEAPAQSPYLKIKVLQSVLPGNTILGRTRDGITFAQYFVSDGRLIYKPNPGEAKLARWQVTPDGRVCTHWDDGNSTACYRVIYNAGRLDWYGPVEMPRMASTLSTSTVLRRGNATFVPIAADPAFRKPDYVLQAAAITGNSITHWLEITGGVLPSGAY